MNTTKNSLLSLGLLALAFGSAAQAATIDEPSRLDAREEKLMASLEADDLAALLRGEPLVLPRDPAEGLLFFPVEPCRLVDGLELTAETEIHSARLLAGSGCGIAPESGKLLRFSRAMSVLLRVELIDADGPGSLALWRAGAPRPASGLVGYLPGAGSIHTAIVPVCAEVGLAPCAEGDIAFALEGGPARLHIDLLGYFAPPAPAGLVAPAADADSSKTAEDAVVARSLESPFWEVGSPTGSIHYSDGYVGIGTFEPNSPLTVVGQPLPYPDADTARFYIRGESSSFRDQISITSQSTAASATGYGIAFAGTDHHRGGIYMRDVPGSSKGELNLWSRSSGNIVLTAGATGVGVADPTAKLHVGGDLKLNLGEGLLFNQNTSYWGVGYDARLIQMLDSNGAKGNVDGGIVFESRTTSDDNRRPVVTIRHDSGYPRLGIGNIYPAGLFEVHSRRETGSGTLTSVGTAVTGTGTTFTQQLVPGAELLVGQQVRRVTAILSDSELTTNVAFPIDLIGASFTYQLPTLLLNPEGKLGLGTGTQPLTEKLELVGNIKLTGNLLAGGDLCIGACS